MIRFLYDNALVDSVLSATNQDINYPITNIYDTRLSKIYKSLTSSIRYTYDAGLGYTLNPTCITINAHNISSAATIKIEGNATNSWATPSFSLTLTYDALCIVEFFTASAYRYWSVSVDDPTNTDGYIQIGHSFIGNYLELTFPIEPNFSIKYLEQSVKHRSPTGQVYGHDSGVFLIDINITIQNITNAQRLLALTMYTHVRNYKPFYFIIDKDYITTLPSIYCTIEDDIEFNALPGYNWDFRLHLVEAK